MHRIKGRNLAAAPGDWKGIGKKEWQGKPQRHTPSLKAGVERKAAGYPLRAFIRVAVRCAVGARTGSGGEEANIKDLFVSSVARCPLSCHGARVKHCKKTPDVSEALQWSLTS